MSSKLNGDSGTAPHHCSSSDLSFHLNWPSSIWEVSVHLWLNRQLISYRFNCILQSTPRLIWYSESTSLPRIIVSSLYRVCQHSLGLLEFLELHFYNVIRTAGISVANFRYAWFWLAGTTTMKVNNLYENATHKKHCTMFYDNQSQDFIHEKPALPKLSFHPFCNIEGIYVNYYQTPRCKHSV